MLPINIYPYINLEDLNLDFLLKRIKELEKVTSDFVSLNSIKYADPIQWNITKQYEKNTVVIDPSTGIAYLSIKEVPNGVDIIRTEYWTPIFNFSLFVNRANGNFTIHIEADGATNATFASSIGDWIIVNGVLYVADSAINIGDTYVINSNIRRITVEEMVRNLSTALTNEINDRISAVNDEITNRTNADNALSTAIAKREINQPNRNYILVFDSYGALGISTEASTACPGGVHVINVGGAGFVGNGGGYTWGDKVDEYLQSLTAEERAGITDIMVFGGINDYTFTSASIISAMTNFNGILQTYIPQAKMTLCPISWATRLDGTIFYYVKQTLSAYSLGATYLKWKYVDGLNAFIHADIYLQADGIHPTTTGAERLGKAVADFIKTGVAPKLSSEPLRATVSAASSGSEACVLHSTINENIVELFGSLVFSYPTPITVVTGATNATLLATISNSYFQGNVLESMPVNMVTVPAYIHNTVTNQWELHPITIQAYYFNIFISVEGGNITFDALQTPFFKLQNNLNLA